MIRSASEQRQPRPKSLAVYLLPTTPIEEVLAFQRRLVFDLESGSRQKSALILCEHPPVITLGRRGSHRHVTPDDMPSSHSQPEMKWINRGGGTWLCAGGMLCAYPVVPLDPFRPALDDYRQLLYDVMKDVLEEYKVLAKELPSSTALLVADRPIAWLGLAVKNWVAYHGCLMNVCVPPSRFDGIQTTPDLYRPVTSMFRELRTPVRMDGVRESFIRHFARRLGIESFYFSSHGTGDVEKQRRNNVPLGNH